MNKVINKFLLAGCTFVPKLHLRQPGITRTVVGCLLNIIKVFKNLKKRDLNYNYIV